MRRQPSRRGLSYYDANKGRLITEGPDVLEIKREIEARWPGVISCFFDIESDEWVVVEHSKDGTDSAVFTTKRLDRRAVIKLQKWDQAMHVQEDLNKKLEDEDAKAERDIEHSFSERMGEHHERLEHALRGAILPFNRFIMADGKLVTEGAGRIRNR